MDIALWYGIVSRGGTPTPIVQQLHPELAKNSGRAGCQQRLG
jgi:hypothetical protein